TARFCEGCGSDFNNPIVAAPSPQNTYHDGRHIESRSFLAMFLLNGLTLLIYPAFFYKKMADDINEMGRCVNLRRGAKKIKLNGFLIIMYVALYIVFMFTPMILFSFEMMSEETLIVTVSSVYGLSLPFVLISGLYMRSKAKQMKLRLFEIAAEYYDDKDYHFWVQTYEKSGWFIWGSPFILIFFFVFFLLLAPYIYAPMLIKMTNEIAEMHNERIE
ncbi:MAG: hypothetical protein FWF82_03585, partial [Oscillospiraceae bacterium]|nr:hypothetical protein [Oscillospiraceae bacterium]